jgi:hypothetical protein
MQSDKCKLQMGVIVRLLNVHFAFRNLHFAILGADHAEAATRGASSGGASLFIA